MTPVEPPAFSSGAPGEGFDKRERGSARRQGRPSPNRFAHRHIHGPFPAQLLGVEIGGPVNIVDDERQIEIYVARTLSRYEGRQEFNPAQPVGSGESVPNYTSPNI